MRQTIVTPVRKHGHGPKSPGKTAAQRPPPVAETSPCVRATHTQQQSAVRDGHAGGSHVSHGRTSHHNKPHGVVMWGTMW